MYLIWIHSAPSTKFHENLVNTFSVILLTNKQTNKPDRKHNLLSGGNKLNNDKELDE